MGLDQHSQHSTSHSKSSDDHKRRTHRKGRAKSAECGGMMEGTTSMESHAVHSLTSPMSPQRRTHERGKSVDGTMPLDQNLLLSSHSPTSLGDRKKRRNKRNERAKSADKWDDQRKHNIRHHHSRGRSAEGLKAREKNNHRRHHSRGRSADGWEAREKDNHRPQHTRGRSTDGWDRRENQNHRPQHSHSRHSKDGADSSKIHRLRRQKEPIKHNKSSMDLSDPQQNSREQERRRKDLLLQHKSLRDLKDLPHNSSEQETRRTEALYKSLRELRDLQHSSNTREARQTEALYKSLRDLRNSQHISTEKERGRTEALQLKSFRDLRHSEHIGNLTGNSQNNMRQIDWVGGRNIQRHHFSNPDSIMSHSMHLDDLERIVAIEREGEDRMLVSAKGRSFATPDSSISHSLDMEDLECLDAMERQNEGPIVQQLDWADERVMQRRCIATPDSIMSHSLDIEDLIRMEAMECQNGARMAMPGVRSNVRQIDWADERGMQRRNFSTPDSSMSHSLHVDDDKHMNAMAHQNEDLRVRIGMLEIQRENDILKTRIEKIESREVSVCSDEPSEHIYKKHKKPQARRQQRRLPFGLDEVSLKIRIIAVAILLLAVVGIAALILSHPDYNDEVNRPLTDDDPIFSSTIFPAWMKDSGA